MVLIKRGHGAPVREATFLECKTEERARELILEKAKHLRCKQMNIRIIGAGFYGCHIATELIADGHAVTIVEAKDEIFGGASGKIPARLHKGFHYPRSKRTRLACKAHLPDFMDIYGQFTRKVPNNIYAIADGASLVDFPQYVDTLRGEVEFTVVDPAEHGLENVEGAVTTGERHIVIEAVKQYFLEELDGHIEYGRTPRIIDNPNYDLTIDATFCAYDSAAVDRYEPCIVGLLEGPTDTAVTVMDGPFSSLYPWDEDKGLCSLSSAKWTPFSKQCRTWQEAQSILDGLPKRDLARQLDCMRDDLARYYPAAYDHKIVGHMLSVRAMPLSGADTRLVDIVDVGERAVRVRAGKIDAVVHAAQAVKQKLETL